MNQSYFSWSVDSEPVTTQNPVVKKYENNGSLSKHKQTVKKCSLSKRKQTVKKCSLSKLKQTVKKYANF